MTTYVGESLTFKVVPTDPVNGVVISAAVVTIEFYEPGSDPKNVVADRTQSGVALTLAWNPLATNRDRTLGAHVGHKLTGGMTAGKWAFRAVITSPTYSSWEYGSFTLRA